MREYTLIRSGRRTLALEVSREGETIVCLPHKLTVHIVGGESSGLDAVAK